MTKLYEIKDGEKTVFGTFLAQNSAGQLVLEIKGTGEVKAFDPAEVTEVKPYTVQIRINSGRSPGGIEPKEFQVPKGVLEVNDYVVFTDGVIGRVSKLDTNAASAHPLSSGVRKLVTEKIAEFPSAIGAETED